MKYVITESQYERVFSKLSGLSNKDSFLDKIKSKLIGGDEDSIGRMILDAIKNGKETDVRYNGEDIIYFEINKTPIQINRHISYRRGGGYYFTIMIPPIDSNHLYMSDGLQKSIWRRLRKKYNFDVE